MTYEAKRIRAQEKANKTGKETCIYETCEGYRIGFLTFKTVGSAQEVFSPGHPTAELSRTLSQPPAEWMAA